MSARNELFIRIHSNLPREGPGDRASTLRALASASGLRTPARILDVGCGPGQASRDLAAAGHDVVALDLHRRYLDQLRKRACDATVRLVQGSMAALPFVDAAFDVIWAEGSIYILGFERGLREWRRLLRGRGYIAVTHLSWLADDPPREPREFWARHYPAMTTVAANLAIARRCGYDVVEHFTLPESAWWDEYYGPMSERLDVLAREHGHPASPEVIAESREQIEIYRRYSASYGYEFYVLRLL